VKRALDPNMLPSHAPPPPGGDLEAAWEMAMVGLLHRPSAGRAMSYFYIFECFVPMQVCARVRGEHFHRPFLVEGSVSRAKYFVRESSALGHVSRGFHQNTRRGRTRKSG